MTPSESSPTLVVGVGASLGGLDAFRQLLTVIPSDSGMAWLLVQHLHPDQDSRLAELLAASTSMSVREAEADAVIVPDTVYVIPRGSTLAVAGGQLVLSPPEVRDGRRTTVDTLFRSLAVDYGPRAVGIVLSGAGRDGSIGLRTLKAAGGLAIAQDPRSADHPGMPRSALETGCVDRVVEIEEIPEVLDRFARLPIETRLDAAEADATNPDGLLDDTTLTRLADVLGEESGFDLASYKPSIISRRVRRRTALSNLTSPAAYAEALPGDPTEQRMLVRDMLIGVTEFFRGPEAFEELERQFVAPLAERMEHGGTLRVWVPGCATGEEAYSIGILLLEAIEPAKKRIRLQIFATDLDAEAIAVARAGVYPASAVPSDERVRRYFEALPGRGLQVRSVLRDRISFAVHDLRINAPFSKIDLVSCRNVLIYLEPEAQQDVLQAFHFALTTDGHLFLGRAESVGPESDLFETISKSARLYRRRSGAGRARSSTRTRFGPRRPAERTARRSDDLGERARQALLTAWAPPSVLVGSDDTVAFFHGDVSRFLRFPEGQEPRLELRQLLRPGLATRTRGALHRCRTENETVVAIATLDGPGSRVRITAKPIGELDGAMLLSFEELDPESAEDPPTPTPRVAVLERELVAVQEDLRNTVEELESSNEELRTTNEEAQSMNEELRSANEELEASSEELRALNEELTTVNEQLREKIGEVERAHHDLRNFTQSTRIAALFLDDQLRMRRFTPAARALVNIDHADMGHSILDLPREILENGLEPDCVAVLESFVPRMTEIELRDGRSFERNVMPYRTDARQVEGVVVTFTDITDRKATESALRESEGAFREMADRLPILVWVHDELGNQTFVNQTYAEYFGVEADEMRGARWQMLVHPDDAPAYTTEFVACVRERRPFRGQARMRRADGEWRRVESWARLREDRSGEFRGFVGSTIDITERWNAEQALRDSESRFRALADNITQLAWMAAPDGTRIWSNLRWTDFTGEPPEASAGDGWVRFVHADHLQRVVEGYRAAFAAREPWEDTFPMQRSDGVERWFLVRASPLRDESGEVYRYVGTHTDITERREAEELLEAADRQKDDFLAMLGHELRNPLAAVRSANELLQRNLDPERTREAIAVIERQTEQMRRLIEGLLDISRIVRQKITIARQPVDLGKLVQEVVQGGIERHPDAERRLLGVDVPPEPVWVDGDVVRLTQVVENLLSNAVKFTDPGDTIEVIVRPVSRSGSKRALLTVRDSGIGVDARLLSEMFEPFRQSEQSVNRDRRGLGLGLSLVRALAELHGGSVSAESAGPGTGTAVMVEFPRGRMPQPGLAPPEPTKPVQPRRLVLIEDDVDVASMLQQVLELEGHDVTVAHDGVSGIEATRRALPDAVLCDLGLEGGTSGLDVARTLRDDPSTSGITLIAVTGYGRRDDIERSLDVGFDAHMTKPLELDQLRPLLAAELSTDDDR